MWIQLCICAICRTVFWFLWLRVFGAGFDLLSQGAGLLLFVRVCLLQIGKHHLVRYPSFRRQLDHLMVEVLWITNIRLAWLSCHGHNPHVH